MYSPPRILEFYYIFLHNSKENQKKFFFFKHFMLGVKYKNPNNLYLIPRGFTRLIKDKFHSYKNCISFIYVTMKWNNSKKKSVKRRKHIKMRNKNEISFKSVFLCIIIS